MKKKLLEKDRNIIKILSKDYMNNIMILEKWNEEYIFIYEEDYNKKDTKELPIKIENKIELNKNSKFHLINNIIPELDLSFYDHFARRAIERRLNDCLYSEGFQILFLKHETLVGVLEGPPDTPYENGFFLFKIILSKEFPFGRTPKFIFISTIFHPNISENGFVSIDILEKSWSPAMTFEKIIYSIQSLLDDPNPDDFLNENAAKIFRENKKNYNKTVREYTSRFANYIKFQEDLKKLNLKIKTINNGEKLFRKK